MLNWNTYRRALGPSPSGFPSKLHFLADALCRPHAFHLTDGEAADCIANDAQIDLPETHLTHRSLAEAATSTQFVLTRPHLLTLSFQAGQTAAWACVHTPAASAGTDRRSPILHPSDQSGSASLASLV